jgi:RHS repeat-associated protein
MAFTATPTTPRTGSSRSMLSERAMPTATMPSEGDLQGREISDLAATPENSGGTICSQCTTDPLQASDIYAGGRHLGLYYNNTTYFTAQDWQGTVRARTDIDGNRVETCTNLPFGDNLNCSSSDGLPGWVDRVHLTGQMHDWTDNLDHFMYRQYTNTQGRWMHPDPAGLAAVDPSNPQTWNRYAYVTNNPLSYVDPTGLNLSPLRGGCNSDQMDCGSSGGSPSDPGAGGATDFSAIGNQVAIVLSAAALMANLELRE